MISISITPQAAARILKSAAESAAGEEVWLRIAARANENGVLEYGMGFDVRGEGDLLSVSEGINVLIAPGSAELLVGATLDYVELNPGEHRFIFINPNDPSHKPPKADGPAGAAAAA